MPLSFHLKKDFYNFKIDVTLDLREEMAVLFGPSGAGKSSILNMIAGLLRPDEGFINIDGREIYNSRKGLNIPIRKRRIGYVFQELALFPHMTVFENIAYGLTGLSKKAIEERVNELLVLMRLVGLEERYPYEISGGQKQRVALARTLITEPKVLLLDEPFTALDYPVREKLRADLIKIHKRYPITTVIVTHDQEEAYILGEKLAVINEGSIEQVGEKGEVFYTPRTRQVAKFLGIMNIFDGVIHSISTKEVVIRNPDLGLVRARRKEDLKLKEGNSISFGIRPEEVMILREDKMGKVVDNPVEGRILDIVERGIQNTLFFKTKDGASIIKIDIPNFAYRKIGVTKDKPVTVSLKKECVWIISS